MPAKKQKWKKELSVALSAAKEAGNFLKSKYGRFRTLRHKPNAGLVTEADKGAEELIISRIGKSFPDHSFLAEESGVTEYLRSNSRWIIDPLDGTTNFVHGFPMFSVSIGLEVDGQLILGVIHHPMEGSTYWAVKGQGAFRNKQRIHVSKTKILKDSMLTTGFSYRRDEYLEKEIRTFDQIIHRSRAIRRIGSAALDLCFVACGQFDGFFEMHLSPWDVAAGLVLLKEAGGQYSDYAGKPYLLGSSTLVASNGIIHRQLLRAVGGPKRKA